MKRQKTPQSTSAPHLQMLQRRPHGVGGKGSGMELEVGTLNLLPAFLRPATSKPFSNSDWCNSQDWLHFDPDGKMLSGTPPREAVEGVEASACLSRVVIHLTPFHLTSKLQDHPQCDPQPVNTNSSVKLPSSNSVQGSQGFRKSFRQSNDQPQTRMVRQVTRDQQGKSVHQKYTVTGLSLKIVVSISLFSS